MRLSILRLALVSAVAGVFVLSLVGAAQSPTARGGPCYQERYGDDGLAWHDTARQCVAA